HAQRERDVPPAGALPRPLRHGDDDLHRRRLDADARGEAVTMTRIGWLLSLLLLVTGCGYSAVPRDVTVAVGQTVTVKIVHYVYGVPQPDSYTGSDDNIMSVTQLDENVTIQGLRPGTAYVRVAGAGINVVNVTVFECPPVTIQARASVIET